MTDTLAAPQRNRRRAQCRIGSGWLALALGASLNSLFVALAFAHVVYGAVVAVAVASGAWYADARRRNT